MVYLKSTTIILRLIQITKKYIPNVETRGVIVSLIDLKIFSIEWF